jgi:hypothetical protein
MRKLKPTPAEPVWRGVNQQDTGYSTQNIFTGELEPIFAESSRLAAYLSTRGVTIKSARARAPSRRERR